MTILDTGSGNAALAPRLGFPHTHRKAASVRCQ